MQRLTPLVPLAAFGIAKSWQGGPRETSTCDVISECIMMTSSPHKGQWRGALMFSLICTWTNGWANYRDAGDSRRHCAHYDVTVMKNITHMYVYMSVMVFLWIRWREKRSRHSLSMRNMQFCVSGKRPMVALFTDALGLDDIMLLNKLYCICKEALIPNSRSINAMFSILSDDMCAYFETEHVFKVHN